MIYNGNVALQVITAYGIGRVRRSKDSKHKEGDLVVNPYSPVAEYYVMSCTENIRKIDAARRISLLDYLSCLGGFSTETFLWNQPRYVCMIYVLWWRAGAPGFAAWVGIEVLGNPKPGSNTQMCSYQRHMVVLECLQANWLSSEVVG